MKTETRNNRPRRASHFRHLAALMLGAAVLLPAVRGQASRDFPSIRATTGQLVKVQVLVDGHEAPLYNPTRCLYRHYFQAFKGRNYSLQVTNQTGRRIGVLITVDGLNVVTGDRSTLSNHESMYVLGPWESTEIKGWRTSLDHVRRFVFVDEERSYAERTDQANGDMGWIRVVTFNEEGWGGHDLDGWFRGELERRNDAPRGSSGTGAAEPPAAAAPRDQAAREARPGSELKAEANRDALSEDSHPGTGWGRQSHDPVRRTRFDAESQPTDKLVLRYEYASGLLALGIDLHPRRNRLREREEGLFGFARPPRH